MRRAKQSKIACGVRAISSEGLLVVHLKENAGEAAMARAGDECALALVTRIHLTENLARPNSLCSSMFCVMSPPNECVRYVQHGLFGGSES